MKTFRIALLAVVALLAVSTVVWYFRTQTTSDPRDCIQGTVKVGDALASALRPGATLFVYAREVARTEGAPTVVTSVKDPRYPQEFRLCPADQMIPGFPGKPLSGRYRVYARHSATGTPMVEEGFAGDTAGEDGSGIPAGGTVDVLINGELGQTR